MQLQTHLISGWCFAALFRVGPRERALAMVAALLPDLDGIGILIDVEYYKRYHHILGHNIFFGLLMALFLAHFSIQKRRAVLLYFFIFQVHVLLDLLGSGPGWGMYYVWPLSNWYLENPYVWELQSWQTMLTFFVFLVWTFVIAYQQQRGPLEALAPTIDRRFVDWVTRFVQK